MAELESLATEESRDRHLARHHLDRLIMLCDGVFAIAVTLAAVEIRVPEGLHTLGDVFNAIGVQLLTYLISFVVIVTFWLSNRDLFARLTRVDLAVTLLTLGTLCFVALIPASSHMIGPSADVTGSLRFYALTMTLSGACNLAAWVYAAYRRGLMRSDVPRIFLVSRILSAISVPLLFGIVLIAPSTAMLQLMIPLAALMVFARRFVIPRVIHD